MTAVYIAVIAWAVGIALFALGAAWGRARALDQAMDIINNLMRHYDLVPKPRTEQYAATYEATFENRSA